MQATRAVIGSLIALAIVVIAGFALRRCSTAQDDPIVSPQAVAPAQPDASASLDAVEKAGATGRASVESLALAPDPSAAEPSASEPELVIEVMQADSTPVARALVVLDVGGIQQSTTDEDGRAPFGARMGEATVYIRRAHAAPYRGVVDASAGTRRVHIPAGGEVSGWIREKGAPPTRSFELRLYSDTKPFPGFDVPQLVAQALGLDSGQHNYKDTYAIERDGAFAFRDLPEHWSGRLMLPRGWALAEARREYFGNDSISLPAAARNLVIDVEHLPQLIGRVLLPSGAPAADAGIQGMLVWKDGDSTSIGARTGPDGRFELALVDVQFRSCDLKIFGPEGRGSASVQRQRSDLGSDLDLGDIVLVAGTRVQLHVTDPAGKPIAGAVALTQGTGQSKTDRNGDCTLEDVPKEVGQVRVVAAGRWGARVPLPLPSTDVHVVKLEPCNRLTIQLHGPGEEATKHLVIQLSTDNPVLFPDTQGYGIDKVLEERHMGKWKHSRSDARGKSVAVFQPDRWGKISFEGIAPAVPLRLVVLDSIGTVLHEATLAGLKRAEQRNEQVRLDVSLRVLAGTVKDTDGQPVPNANAYVSVSERNRAWQLTDTEGRFRFPLLGERVDLDVEKDGFAHVRRTGVTLSRPIEEIAITLERGRSVIVEVLDPRARSVEGGHLTATSVEAGVMWGGKSAGPGRFELVDLPSEEMTLRLQLAGREYVKRHDPRVSQARIEVPAHGRVDVKWTLPAGSKQMLRVVQMRPVEAGTQAFLGKHSSLLEGESRFEAVYPGEYDIVLARYGAKEELIPDLPLQRIHVIADQAMSVAMGP